MLEVFISALKHMYHERLIGTVSPLKFFLFSGDVKLGYLSENLN